MNKQEEIREGIAKRIWDWWRRNSDDLPHLEWCDVTGGYRGVVLAITDICIEFEVSQGVVIKVDRELPKYKESWESDGKKFTDILLPVTADDLIKAGYVATEPLVEG